MQCRHQQALLPSTADGSGSGIAEQDTGTWMSDDHTIVITDGMAALSLSSTTVDLAHSSTVSNSAGPTTYKKSMQMQGGGDEGADRHRGKVNADTKAQGHNLRSLVGSQYLHDTVRVNFESDFNLRNATGCW